MIILHCLKALTWQNHKSKTSYGEDYISSEGFIHCSDIFTFHNVAPNFAKIKEDLILLCIDTEKVQPEIKWEDLDNYGTSYPHIYGLLNLDAVIEVLPYHKDEQGNWIFNTELDKYKTN